MASLRPERILGVCAVCGEPGLVVKTCRMCGRFIGDCCRYNVLKRGKAALKVLKEKVVRNG